MTLGTIVSFSLKTVIEANSDGNLKKFTFKNLILIFYHVRSEQRQACWL